MDSARTTRMTFQNASLQELLTQRKIEEDSLKPSPSLLRPVTHRGQIQHLQVLKKRQSLASGADSILGGVITSGSQLNQSKHFRTKSGGMINQTSQASSKSKHYQDFISEWQKEQTLQQKPSNKLDKSQLEQDLSSTINLYGESHSNKNNQKDMLSTSDKQTLKFKSKSGNMTERQSLSQAGLNKNLQSTFRSSFLNHSSVQDVPSNDTKSKTLHFLHKTQDNPKQNQPHKQGINHQHSSQQKSMQKQYEFDIQIQKIEQTYKEFEEYFNQFKEEKIASQLNQIHQNQQEEQKQEISEKSPDYQNQRSSQKRRDYEKTIIQATIDNVKMHENIVNRFHKMQILKKELNEFHQSLEYISYNRAQNDWKAFLSNVTSSQCQCMSNRFLNQVRQSSSPNKSALKSQFKQEPSTKDGSQTYINVPSSLQTNILPSKSSLRQSFQHSRQNSQSSSSFYLMKESKPKESGVSTNRDQIINIHAQKPLQVQVKITNQGKDLQISLDGYMPLSLNLQNLTLSESEKYVIEPMQTFIEKQQDNIQNVFLKEVEKQNRDLRIFEQFQKSFLKETQIKSKSDARTESMRESDSDYKKVVEEPTKLVQSWKRKDKHNIIHQKIIKETSQQMTQISKNEEESQRNILDNEVMKSLFDMEMCLSCKYQRILYRDFIAKLQGMDMKTMPEIDKELNSYIKLVIENFMDGEIQFNNYKHVQKVITKLLKINQKYLASMGKVLPLHAIFGEKSFKFFSFIFSIMFELYNESFQSYRRQNQSLQTEVQDLSIAQQDNEIMRIELLELRQELLEKNLLIKEYEDDKHVAIKDIERDLDKLNDNFMSHAKNHLKLKEAIEKEVKVLLGDIMGENKQHNSQLEQMLDIILKKFEIVKYSLEQNLSVGTQTIIVGTSKVSSSHQGVGAITCGEHHQVPTSNRKQYHHIMDIYRPLLSFDLQKRRFYEVFEIQNICEEFINFITLIKMKPNETIQINLSKLPNTYHLENQRKASIKLQRRLSKVQGAENQITTYIVDRKGNPALKDIIKFGSKDEILNYLTEFLAVKRGIQRDGIILEINHFLVSLENVAQEKQSLCAKMLLLMIDYGTDFVQFEAAHDHKETVNNQSDRDSMSSSESHSRRKSTLSAVNSQAEPNAQPNLKNPLNLGNTFTMTSGQLKGELINVNEVINEKMSQMLYQAYYLLEKVLKKDKYIKIFLGNQYQEDVFSFHKPDLKNKKISLRVIFTVFDRLLGKLSLHLREELVDALYQHYAQNDDYREAKSTQKYFSIIAAQIMMKNQTRSLHYDWIVNSLFGLITTKTQVSLHDLISDEYTNENLFQMVQKQFEQDQAHQDKEEKKREQEILDKQEQLKQLQTNQSKSKTRKNSSRKSVKASIVGNLVKKVDSNHDETNKGFQVKAKQTTGNDNFDTSMINFSNIGSFTQNLTQQKANQLQKIVSAFDSGTLDDQIQYLEPKNHITDEFIKNKVDQKKDFIIQSLSIESFIKLLNYSKLYLPCIKEALEGYQTYFYEQNDQNIQVRVEKPQNQIKIEQQYLSLVYIMKQESLSCNLDSFFTILRRYLINERTYLIGLLDFISLFMLLISKYLEDKKKIVHEKYRQLDPLGKGLKDQDVQQLLISLDFHRVLKQRQFLHIHDELRLMKMEQIRASDKIEEFQKLLDEKKSDSFLNFKYKEIQHVIENKWFLMKELIEIKEDFLSIQRVIERNKALQLQQLKAGSLLNKEPMKKIEKANDKGITILQRDFQQRQINEWF